jgi:hypothetical protein
MMGAGAVEFTTDGEDSTEAALEPVPGVGVGVALSWAGSSGGLGMTGFGAAVTGIVVAAALGLGDVLLDQGVGGSVAGWRTSPVVGVLGLPIVNSGVSGVVYSRAATVRAVTLCAALFPAPHHASASAASTVPVPTPNCSLLISGRR